MILGSELLPEAFIPVFVRFHHFDCFGKNGVSWARHGDGYLKLSSVGHWQHPFICLPYRSLFVKSGAIKNWLFSTAYSTNWAVEFNYQHLMFQRASFQRVMAAVVSSGCVCIRVRLYPAQPAHYSLDIAVPWGAVSLVCAGWAVCARLRCGWFRCNNNRSLKEALLAMAGVAGGLTVLLDWFLALPGHPTDYQWVGSNLIILLLINVLVERWVCLRLILGHRHYWR